MEAMSFLKINFKNLFIYLYIYIIFLLQLFPPSPIWYLLFNFNFLFSPPFLPLLQEQMSSLFFLLFHVEQFSLLSLQREDDHLTRENVTQNAELHWRLKYVSSDLRQFHKSMNIAGIQTASR